MASVSGSEVRAERPDPMVVEFAAALREFHARCGAPTYRSLVATSRRLAELYPDDLRGRRLPDLSVTAISEVLGGKRSRPPQAGWVTVFVLSCQRRAWEEGMLEADPGVATVREWMKRLRQVLITFTTQEHSSAR
jgi:hypothetical protein